MNPRFTIGQVVCTPGALQALEASGESPHAFLRRHMTGDWGEVCPEDAALNDAALVDGSRILSAYHTGNRTKLWVITEADRSSTAFLLPSEY